MTHRPARRAKTADERRALVLLALAGSDIRLDWRDRLAELRADMDSILAMSYAELWTAHVATPEQYHKLMHAALLTWELTDDEPELLALLRGGARNPAVMAGL